MGALVYCTILGCAEHGVLMIVSSRLYAGMRGEVPWRPHTCVEGLMFRDVRWGAASTGQEWRAILAKPVSPSKIFVAVVHDRQSAGDDG